MRNSRDVETLDKITAFVTRGDGAERELLVFRHPTGGVQLPAGTVEAGEDVTLAAQREVMEETGLHDALVVAHLASLPQEPMRPNERVLLRSTGLRATPEVDAPFFDIPDFPGLRRGLYVRETAVHGDFSEIVYEEYARIGDKEQELVITRTLQGWLPSDSITDTVVRHFFHLTPTGPTQDRWVQIAEEWEHAFQLYWVPLSEDPNLISFQGEWVTMFTDRLRG